MNFSRPGRTSPSLPQGSLYASPRANEDESNVSSSWLSRAATDDGEDDIRNMPSSIPAQGMDNPVGDSGSAPARPAGVFGGTNSRTFIDGKQVPLQNLQIFNTPFVRGLNSAMSETFTGTSSGSLRPSTAESRSHVPSLASRAFLTPMSSQKLQAHRGQRPWSMHDAPASVLEDFDDRSTTNRNSTGSGLTIRGGHALPTQADIDALPRNTASRASTRTDWTDADMSAHPEFVASGIALVDREDMSQTGVDQEDVDDNDERRDDLHIPDDRYTESVHTNGFLNGHGGSAEKDTKMDSNLLDPSEESPIIDEKMRSQRAVVRQNLGRNHEYFAGNTVFFLGGRLQNARDRPIVIITAIIVLLPAVLFFIFSAPWLWHHVSPAVPIIFAYILFICMSSFIHASLTDPGILPRNIHPFPTPDPNADPLTLGPSTTDWVVVKSAVSQHGAFEVPTKYCKSCNIWRPPRCHHCRVCDNCVETQDHHCMWLNNCVGRRNYRYFYTFISSGTLLGIYLFAASAAHVWAWKSQNHSTTAHAINSNRVPFAMFIYGLIAFVYPASLWGYHFFLIARGQTTREYLNSTKFAVQDRHRPFKQKPFWRNFLVVLVRPRPPTYLGFKRRYEEGDQRFGERKGRKTAPLTKEQQGGGGGVEMASLQTGARGFQGPVALNGDRTARGGESRGNG